MKQPMWIYKTLLFGVFGIGMLVKVILDLPEISNLFLFGGIGFSLVFIIGSIRVLKEIKELNDTLEQMTP